MHPTITLLAAAALAGDGTWPFPVHTARLDNGLTLHVVPMGTPDVAAVYTWMAVGSRDEVDPGRTGFAHFFEHLAFYGTPTLAGPARDRKLLTLGVEENAWTWLDETVYHATLPAQHVPTWLAMEADRLANLQLTAQDVQKEAGAVYGEYRKNAADPYQALHVAVNDAAFTAHTYRHDTIGYEADIAAMPDAFAYSQAFHDRFYRPENATLIVTGDVDPAAVEAVVREHWSAWSRGTRPRPEIPVEPEQTAIRRVEVPWPSPTAPQLVMAWKAPASDPTNPDVVALQAVADLLLSPVGPLEQRLVREERLAYEVGGWRGDNVDPGLFTIVVTCREPEHLDAAERIVREELARLGTAVDAAVLDRTRTHERYAWLTGLEDPDSVASDLGSFLRRHPHVAGIDTFWSTYAALTPDQVSSVASKVFVDERLTVGRLRHTPAAEAP